MFLAISAFTEGGCLLGPIAASLAHVRVVHAGVMVELYRVLICVAVSAMPFPLAGHRRGATASDVDEGLLRARVRSPHMDDSAAARRA